MKIHRYTFIRVLKHGKVGYGTGYLLSGNRVITARHVVDQASKIDIHFGTKEQKTTEAQVIWKGQEEKLDAAILAVETGLRLAGAYLDPRPLRDDEPMRSRGWACQASAPKSDENVFESITPLGGTAYGFARGVAGFELSVDAPPKGAVWHGISGAAVFCGDRLVGVIKSGRKIYEGKRIDAVPIHALWNAPGFCEAIGKSEDTAREQALLSEVAAMLAASPDAFTALSAASPWNAAESQDETALARLLLGEMEISDFLYGLDEAHSALYEEGKTAEAQVIEKILVLLGPAHVRRRFPLDLPNPGAIGDDHPLHLATPTIAELAIAELDQRPGCYRPVKGDFPRAEAFVDLPDVETGLDTDGTRNLKELASDLEDELLVPSQRQRIEKLRKRRPAVSNEARTDPAREEKAMAEVFRAANSKIRHDARKKLRRYAAYDEEYAKFNPRFLALLAKYLPEMHRFKLQSDDFEAEDDWNQILMDLLGRAHAQE